MNIVYQLSSGANMDFYDIYEKVPWIEFVDFKGQTDEQRVERSNSFQGTGGVRAFKSHMPTPPLPFKDDVKYVVVVRNPYDVAISMFHFLRAHNPAFFDHWGFHPKLEKPGDILPLIEHGPMVFPFINCWWNLRSKPNVLLLHYSNLLKDLPKEMNRVRAFIGVNLDEEVFKQCVHNCTFAEMKKHEDKYEGRSIGPVVDGKNISPLMSGAMLRKGANGDSKEGFTVEEQAQLTKLVETKFPDAAMRQWVLFGGDY